MEKIMKELRKDSSKLSHMCQDGNLQSVFSCLEIVWTLYDRIMNWKSDAPMDKDRDIFIISKGQATLALFPVLIKKGLFSWDDMKSIGQFDSKFCIQTDVTKFCGGVENNAGSLGHGFPFAAGIAMANKILNSPSKVFVLVGDGEFTEGTMWETCIFAAAKKLDNLYVIIDDNQSVGAMVDMGSMRRKLEAFDFTVTEANGHSLNELEEALKKKPIQGKPNAIIAHTVRGYGSPTMMEHDVWFHKAPNDEELNMLINEVEEF